MNLQTFSSLKATRISAASFWIAALSSAAVLHSRTLLISSLRSLGLGTMP